MENEQLQEDDDPSLTAYLKWCKSKSYQQRFEMATRLFKVQQTFKRAKITHQPDLQK